MTTPALRRSVLALAALGPLFAGACSADEPAPKPAAVTTPSAGATTPAPAVTTPSATPVPSKKPGKLKLGQKQVFAKDEFVVDVAALKVKRGADYEGVQVRVCNRGPEVSVSRLPWKLGYDNFEQLHEIDISGGGLPAPAFEDRDLAEGDCAKGWVNFTSVDGERPDGVQYQPEGAEPARWSF